MESKGVEARRDRKRGTLGGEKRRARHRVLTRSRGDRPTRAEDAPEVRLAASHEARAMEHVHARRREEFRAVVQRGVAYRAHLRAVVVPPRTSDRTRASAGRGRRRRGRRRRGRRFRDAAARRWTASSSSTRPSRSTVFDGSRSRACASPSSSPPRSSSSSSAAAARLRRARRPRRATAASSAASRPRPARRRRRLASSCSFARRLRAPLGTDDEMDGGRPGPSPRRVRSLRYARRRRRPTPDAGCDSRVALDAALGIAARARWD